MVKVKAEMSQVLLAVGMFCKVKDYVFIRACRACEHAPPLTEI
jgi:hypothetical protein